jgi:serine/threonine-protein kinase RsbT
VAAAPLVVAQRFSITSSAAAHQVPREARALAVALGFSRPDAEGVALAVRELATNLVRYASHGEIVLSAVDAPRVGIEITCRDRGPGIADLPRALEDGFSTGTGLGSGLPGARRLMDDFEIASGTSGTTIVARKWLNER